MEFRPVSRSLMAAALLNVLVCGFGTAYADEPKTQRPFEEIDEIALETPRQAEQSLDHLAAYFKDKSETDIDKARLVYRWMADRIHYDVDAYFTEHPGELRPDIVLQRRKATCYGFSYLFEDLARRCGLEAVTLTGSAKGISAPNPQEGWPMANHSWNAVKIDNQWCLLDVTRASGFLKRQRFRRVFQDQYFLTPPAQFALTHFPADPGWQLLARPVTWQEFNGLPYNRTTFLNLGVISETQWKMPDNPGFHHSTRPYLHHGSMRILAAPQGGELYPGKAYFFLIDSHQAERIALLNNDQWVHLKQNGTRFEGSIRPRPGELKLLMQPRRQDGTFQPVITYSVRDYPWVRRR